MYRQLRGMSNAVEIIHLDSRSSMFQLVHYDAADNVS
jgi:hypothetical protein